MEQEFGQLCRQDIKRFAGDSSRSKEKRKELEKMHARFVQGVSDLIAVVPKELPYVMRKETTLSPAPAGQLPESVKSEVARMAMRGESTKDIPRVAFKTIETEEKIKGVSKLKLHIFVPSTPSILSETDRIEQILQFLKTTLSVSKEELEQAGDLKIEELEVKPNLLKSGSRGVELFKLNIGRVSQEYLEAAWGATQKPAGIKNIDLDSELREYLSEEIEPKPDQLDLIVVSGFGTVNAFCYSHRTQRRFSATFKRGRESSAVIFSQIFGQDVPYIYFSAWQSAHWTEKEGYGVIGNKGAIYSVETIEEYRKRK